MKIKFNNGNGAYLCDRCSKIVYTNFTKPKSWDSLSTEELQKMPLICDECLNEKDITIKEFYEQCIARGCTDDTILSVECCPLYGFGDLSTFVEKNTFVVDPDLVVETDDMERFTLKRFCDECRARGCEDDTIIKIFYCHLSAFDVREIEWWETGKKELAICID